MNWILWKYQRHVQCPTRWCFHRYLSPLFASRDWFTSRSNFTFIDKCCKSWVNQKKRSSSQKVQHIKKSVLWWKFSFTVIQTKVSCDKTAIPKFRDDEQRISNKLIKLKAIAVHSMIFYTEKWFAWLVSCAFLLGQWLFCRTLILPNSKPKTY